MSLTALDSGFEEHLFAPNRSHNLIKHISSALLSFVISPLSPPLSSAAAFSLFAHTPLKKEKERRKKEGYKQSAVEATKTRRGL